MVKGELRFYAPAAAALQVRSSARSAARQVRRQGGARRGCIGRRGDGARRTGGWSRACLDGAGMSDARRHARGAVPHRRAGARAHARRRVGRAGRRRRDGAPARGARVPERRAARQRPRARASCAAFARRAASTAREVDLDADAGPSARRPAPASRWSALRTRARRQGARVERALRHARARRPIALPRRRRRVRAGRLRAAARRARAHPAAVLASARTTLRARGRRCSRRVMAAPYGVDFPNLSPQLYAARTDAAAGTRCRRTCSSRSAGSS